MDTLLKDGGHAVSSRGLPVVITGEEEILQRAAIRLGVKKGSLPYAKELGSKLFMLVKAETETMNRQAMSFAVEALRPMPEVWVVSAKCEFLQPDVVSVEIGLSFGGRSFVVEVSI